jgi:hypothetical protein
MSVIQLYKEHPGTYKREILGTITEEQLDFLVENFDEDFEEDEEYLLGPETMDYLREQGADSELINILEKALSGTQDGIEISYRIE